MHDSDKYDDPAPVDVRPSEDDIDGRRIRASLARRMFGDEPEQVRLGRFVVLERLGAGAMGVVHGAYDPELDRKVAVKVMRPPPEGVDAGLYRERTLREGRAMARLSHTNVIGVYDVGTLDDRVFFAMEYVDGQTLRRWLHAAQRSWRDVVEVFQQAGAGLVAAHRAGLVHRDFKPDNVLVGRDGRVRVTDFGVAHALDADAVESTRALVGTPRYMAPEQFRGEPVTPGTDQFAFCVALYEALYGVQPFSAETRAELVEAVTSGAVREPPSNSDVPSWLHKLVVRGLRVDPDDRFGSMEALLGRLARDPAATGRRLAAGAVATAALVGVVLVLRPGPSPGEVCDSARELAGVWDAQRKTAIRSRFVATKRPYAKKVFSSAERSLDAYVDTWKASYRRACVQRRARDADLDDVRLRTSCLNQRLHGLRALTDVLARADGDVVDNAAQASMRLPGVARCDDLESLRRGRAHAELPNRAGERIINAEALWAAGKRHEAHKIATAVLAELGQRGGTTAARALTVRGRFETGEGKHRAAQRTLEAAAWYAIAARDYELAANTMGTVASIVGAKLLRVDDGQLWLRRARGLLGDDYDARLEATLHHAEGTIHQRAGKYGAAIASYRRAVERRRRVLPPGHPDLGISVSALALVLIEQGRRDDGIARLRKVLDAATRSFGEAHPLTASAINNLGLAHSRKGDYAAAAKFYRRALAARIAAHGPEHPEVAKVYNNLGRILAVLGKAGQAETHYRRALAMWTKTLGAGHPDLALALTNLGLLAAARGKDDEALAHHRRALAIRKAGLSDNHTRVADSLQNIAAMLTNKRDFPGAEASLRAALRIWETTHGSEHSRVGLALHTFGNLLVVQGKVRESIPLYRRALAIWSKTYKAGHRRRAFAEYSLASALRRNREFVEAVDVARTAVDSFRTGFGAKSKMLAYPLTELGASLTGAGKPQPAIAVLERALAMRTKPSVPRAETQLALASALWDTSRDRNRARRLARQAQAAVTANKGKDPEAEQLGKLIAAWLRSH